MAGLNCCFLMQTTFHCPIYHQLWICGKDLIKIYNSATSLRTNFCEKTSVSDNMNGD